MVVEVTAMSNGRPIVCSDILSIWASARRNRQLRCAEIQPVANMRLRRVAMISQSQPMTPTSRRLAGKSHEQAGTKRGRHRAYTDLVRLWEDHFRYDFETRSTDDTPDTMVEDAY